MTGRFASISKPFLWLLGGIGAAVIFLWVLLAFFLLSEKPVKPEAPAPQQVAESVAPARSEPMGSAGFLDNLVEGSWDTAGSRDFTEEEDEPSPPDEPWQAAINSILTDDAEPVVLSKRLAVALPGMPLEGQLEAAQHMVNLLGDEEYVTAESIYFHAGMPDQVRRLVFEDFMNRPNALKLPLLVRTLREYGHPLRGEALENLQVYIGRDEGDDPNRWDAAVREALEKERLEQQAIAAEQGQSP